MGDKQSNSTIQHSSNTKRSDQKHRKLVKSPQVSCDIPVLSTIPYGDSIIGTADPGSVEQPVTLSPSPVYPTNPIPILTFAQSYPSSSPKTSINKIESHPSVAVSDNDECSMKTFEYLQSSDLSMPIAVEQSYIPSIKPFALVTNLPAANIMGCIDGREGYGPKNVDTNQIISVDNKLGILSNDSTIDANIKTSFTDTTINLYQSYHRNEQSEEPTARQNESDIKQCSMKIINEKKSSTFINRPNLITSINETNLYNNNCNITQHPNQLQTMAKPNTKSTEINNSLQQTTTISQQTIATTAIPSTPSIQTTTIHQPIKTTKENDNHKNHFNHMNPFLFGTLFKLPPFSTKPPDTSTTKISPTGPKSPTTIFGGQKYAGTAMTPQRLQPAAPKSPTNYPFLSGETINKRDEFLRATMKICLVVSPPSNKLLQLKSKSLTQLDSLDEKNGTGTEGLITNTANGEFLEVQNPGSNICCISPSHTSFKSTTSSSLKKKSPSLSQSSKKPTLSRSQVSSSEYFSVHFNIVNGASSGEKEEEFIPAIKGVSLSDALYDALNRRNLTFSQITITDNSSSMEIGTPPYSTVINRFTDVGNLVGKVLSVTENDGIGGSSKKSGHFSLQKAASFGSRTRPAKLFQSASTEETTEHSDQTKSVANKQPKPRWSVLFGLKNPHQNQLCEILNSYARNGVPQPYASYSFDHTDLPAALDYLENIHTSWTEFVNKSDMMENEIKIQSAIWELVTTEVDYIHALQTVTDLFVACLVAIQAENILIDIDQNKLFSNIRDICEANIKFWTLYIYPVVRQSIKTGHIMCVDYLQQGFVTFATTFAPYKKYCAEQSTCQYYCKELNRNNPLFTAYLAWCESQKLCNRLRLADILVRPMQRLTKYSLLLTAIRKHITDENDGEIMDAMTHSVENFVCSVNAHLTTRQENERLKGIMARIEAYDVVDSNNENLDKMARQYSTMFDLCGPMKGCATTHGRHLFMEGDLKFKDNINKADVHCFLLTDILLVCKTIAKKGLGTLKVIRQPFITDRLVVKVKENTLFAIYLNEFNVAVTAFTLQCLEAKHWHDAITKAKHIYSRLKQGSPWDGLNTKYTNNIDTLSVRKSPLNSSIGSRVSSLNNSHSGSVEFNESKTVSVDYEKTNSLSSDEGMSSLHGSTHGFPLKKVPQNSPTKYKTTTSNTLVVQPLTNLGQSLPNLNVNSTHYASNNTLVVPGSPQTNLLSPSHRGISYPPPSPTRATLRRGFAFSSSVKNPPLVKSRNITSQGSFNTQLHSQLPGPATSPQQSPSNVARHPDFGSSSISQQSIDQQTVNLNTSSTRSANETDV